MNAIFDPASAILVGICSSHLHPERRQACRDTWLRKQPKGVASLFFAGRQLHGDVLEADSKEDDLLILDAPDSYEALPEKVLTFFQWALKNSQFKWLFKCDDDTYLDLERLKALPDPQFHLIGDRSLERRGSPSGGAGYLLSRSAVERLCRDRSIALRGPEDIIIGTAIAGYGLKSLSTDRLCLHSHRYPSPGNTMISAHWCGPDRMQLIHDLNRKSEHRTVKVIHPLWEDSILLFPSGTFTRRQSSCSGHWSELPSGQISLKWFDWAEERLIPLSPDGLADSQPCYRCEPAADQPHRNA